MVVMILQIKFSLLWRATMNKLLILFLLVCLFPYTSYAVNLGVYASTYKIAEQDLLKVIEERAKQVDWKKYIDKAKEEAKLNAGRIVHSFPKADDNKTRFIDLTTMLTNPIYIRDKSGTPKLLYPKGYRFNPLEYISLKQKYFYFDATRKEELKYFKDNFANDLTVLPIITNGNALKLGEEFKREIYIIDDEQIDKFKITVTPTLIFQNYKQLQVNEIYLKSINDTNIVKNGE